jgi:hypothetical protein
VPDWVTEGIAVYYSEDPGLELVREDPALIDRRTLTEITHLTTLSDPRVGSGHGSSRLPA